MFKFSFLLLVLLGIEQHAKKPNKIEFTAYDLSEDMSRVSTHDDELVLYLFSSQLDSQLKTLIWYTAFILDDEHKVHADSFPPMNSGTYAFVLLEQDDEVPSELRAEDIKKQGKEILKAYTYKNYNLLKKYIGDDDILWFAYMDYPFSTQPIEIEGSSKLDKYKYVLEFLD